MMILLFWFSAGMIFYSYFGYPVILVGMSLFKRQELKRNTKLTKLPDVSFIITAHNEEDRIKIKLKETLKLDYPKEKLEIIVASDCSDDKTDDIVRSFEEEGVVLVRSPKRGGKEAAQGHAVKFSKGDILIFSDVSTNVDKNAVINIVKNFVDLKVGCVSSEDKFIESDGTVSGEGAYVKYEMFLRRLESKINTIVGLSGSFFAARRTVCQNWAPDLQSDFNTLLNSVKLGLKGVSDPESVGYYKNISDEKKEYNRKVRTVLRGISVFSRSLSVLNPFTYGLFSWQIFSHKVCRWLVPFFLIFAFVSNFALAFDSIVYLILFVCQILFYSLGILFYICSYIDMPIKASLVKIPYYFTIVNLSIIHAWYRFFRGERLTFWEPSKR